MASIPSKFGLFRNVERIRMIRKEPKAGMCLAGMGLDTGTKVVVPEKSQESAVSHVGVNAS